MTQLLTKTTDQRIVLYGTWEKFKLMQQVSEDSPGVRLAFYQEEIEIFMPGRDHEIFASIIGYLVTTFLVNQGVFLSANSIDDAAKRRRGVCSSR